MLPTRIMVNSIIDFGSAVPLKTGVRSLVVGAATKVGATCAMFRVKSWIATSPKPLEATNFRL